MRRFDIWQSEREAATVEEHGIRVFRDGLHAIIWNPKATKPTANYRFRSEEHREDYIRRFKKSQAQHLQAKEEAREEARKAVETGLATIDVGHIFCYSWGYDQTNVEYFQVVEKHGQSLTLREIAQSTVPGSEGMMCCKVEPRIGHFLEKAEPFTKRVKFTGDGRAYLSMPYGWCELWRGGSHYRSWYA